MNTNEQISHPAPSDLSDQPTPKRLALWALILGIVAFFIGWMPVIGFLVGGFAIVLGSVAIVRKQPKGFSVTGIILGSLAVVTSITMTIAVALNDGLTSESETVMVEVPELEGLPGNEAEKKLQELELQAEFLDATDANRTVIATSRWEVETSDPLAGETIELGETVTLKVTKISDRKAAEKAAAKKEAQEKAEKEKSKREEEKKKQAETKETTEPEESPKTAQIEVLDMSYDNVTFVTVSYPVSDAFTKNGILRNLKEGCVEAIKVAKNETENWWDYDTIQCMGMADWTDRVVAVGSANFTGTQLSAISDSEMDSNPEGFWASATQSNVLPELR